MSWVTFLSGGGGGGGGITCLAVISFLQLLCKRWGFELGDNVHFGYCAHVLLYVAPVGLPSAMW